ncbi:VOC family protein [Paenibacillus alvei]
MRNLLIESHCIFPSQDILKTANFYEQKMGFKAVHYLNTKEPHVCLYRDTTEIILTKTNGQKVIPNRDLYGYGYDAYFITKNQEELQEEFISSNVNIVRSLDSTDYQNKEFVVEDIDGRWIAFGIKVG